MKTLGLFLAVVIISIIIDTFIKSKEVQNVIMVLFVIAMLGGCVAMMQGWEPLSDDEEKTSYYYVAPTITV